MAPGSAGGERGREAVGGDDVETDPGEEDDAGLHRLGVPGEDRLEDPDLPGDVEVGDPRLQAGRHGRPRSSSRTDPRPGGAPRRRETLSATRFGASSSEKTSNGNPRSRPGARSLLAGDRRPSR